MAVVVVVAVAVAVAAALLALSELLEFTCVVICVVSDFSPDQNDGLEGCCCFCG